MALQHVKSYKSKSNEIVVVLANEPGKGRTELTERDAQRQAIELAAPYLNRAGFNKMGNWGYIPEGKTEPLTDEEMMVPGNVVPGKGCYIQEFVIAGQP